MSLETMICLWLGFEAGRRHPRAIHHANGAPSRFHW